MAAKSGAGSSILAGELPAVVEALAADLDSGLGHAEVERRLRQFGHNEVAEKRPNPWLRFAKRFWGLSAWMLELIVLLSLILGHRSDLYVVTALLLLNAVLGYWQERRAGAAVEALRRRLQVQARVLRDGRWQAVPARGLVPGDVVRLRPGDFVPADVKVASGELSADQSSLTGESLAVDKMPGDVLYAGSVIVQGEATGVVVLTGAATFFGRTTELVQLARPKLHAEVVIARVVRWLFAIVGVLLVVALVFSAIEGLPLLDMLPLLLVLLLGAVPVALPAMFTVTMALGAHKLAGKGVLVTRLSASDDAASMKVLCIDKTGTITANRLTVTAVVPLGGATADEVLRYGALASEEANHDPIDAAVLAEAARRGLTERLPERLSFVPFDPRRRCTQAVVAEGPGEGTRVAKGAVAALAELCHLPAEGLTALQQRAEKLAAGGSRVLAVARGNGGEEPRLLGLLVLTDAPRQDAADLIRRLRGLGIAVKMLTGDALPVARAVAAAVGLGTNVRRMEEIEQVAKTDPALAERLADESDGFAEIYPEGKYDVVKELQARGHIVGMTGDGVNDAPALRQAEVGIAMSNATDVAKGAASVVLTQEGLDGIVDLVIGGRQIYQRIAIWVVNKISRTILKTAFVVVAFLATGQFVVSAFAMLLMMFLTDFVKVSLSTDNVRPSSHPEVWDVGALVRVGAVMGVLMVMEALALLAVGYRVLDLGADSGRLSTFSFAILFYFAMFSIFAVRERRHFWESVPSRPMLTAIGVDLVVGTLLITIGLPGLAPLSPVVALSLLLASALCSLVLNDLAKIWMVKRTNLAW
ncbi:MAG: plasma-membrane proton-efflux P-type ATPase [Anaerolineae bacterium]